MPSRSNPLSLGYYGFLAVVIGTVFILVGMRPVPRTEKAQSTQIATITGSSLVVAGTVALGVHAWREQRERRRSSEEPTSTQERSGRDRGGDVG